MSLEKKYIGSGRLQETNRKKPVSIVKFTKNFVKSTKFQDMKWKTRMIMTSY